MAVIFVSSDIHVGSQPPLDTTKGWLNLEPQESNLFKPSARSVDKILDLKQLLFNAGYVVSGVSYRAYEISNVEDIVYNIFDEENKSWLPSNAVCILQATFEGDDVTLILSNDLEMTYENGNVMLPLNDNFSVTCEDSNVIITEVNIDE